MCGIVGVAGQINMNEEKAFKTLLELDTVRGPHSTGVVVINSRGESDFEKTLGTPWQFYKKSKIFSPKGIYKGVARVLLGHNRFATTGKVTIKNAHPFDFDRIIGVHNGTLDEDELKGLDEHKKYSVDSQVLFHNINSKGIDKTIPDVCGAYSLVWWDKKEKLVYFLRNLERPMHYMYLEHHKTVFWASEKWMLTTIEYKHGLKVNDILTTKPDHLYTLNVAAGEHGNEIEYKYIVETLKGKTRPKKSWSGLNAYLSGSFGGYQSSVNVAHIGGGSSYRNISKPQNPPEVFSRINIYCNPKENTLDTRTPAFINMRECETHVKVRVICGDKHWARELIEEAENWEYFTIMPNSRFDFYSIIEAKSNKGYIAQGNSIKGPYEYKKPVAPKKEKSNVVRLYTGYNGSMHSEEDMKVLIANGCAWCGENSFDAKNYHKVVWIADDEFVCGKCDGNEFIQPWSIH